MKTKAELPIPSIRRRLAVLAVTLVTGIVIGFTYRSEPVNQTESSAAGTDLASVPTKPFAAIGPVEPSASSGPVAVAVPAQEADAEDADPEARRGEEQQAAFKALPHAEQASLWKALRAARREIQPLTEAQSAMPRNEGVRYFASNPGQQLTARFLDGAVRVESGRGGEWAGTLALAGGTEVAPVLVGGDRVEYHHRGGITEWYVNQPDGIEQGFTLATRPVNASAGEVRVELELAGLSARPVEGEAALDFVHEASGSAVLRYDKLLVWDATGRELPARFEAQDGRVAILVADAGAAYPLTIDPLITSQEGKLLALDGAAADSFGISVALAGETALVGAHLDDTAAGSNAGSAYVFARSGTAWSQQAKLMAVDAAADDRFGNSVALSGDTALVGASQDDTAAAGSNAGSAYVFLRGGTEWSQQAKLEAGDAAVNDSFGSSVTLSGDTALVGASQDDTAAGSNAGSAYVFARSGTEWSQQAKLMADDAAASDIFGSSVALWGETALVGAYLNDDAGTDSGSAYVFVRSGTEWSQQAKLVADDAAAFDYFGISVAMSQETALVGAYWDDTASGTETGSAFVFVRNGTAWSQQAKLVPPYIGVIRFGTSVALSDDTALIGAFRDDAFAGSAFVFTRSGTVWSEPTKLAAVDPAPDDRFGTAVALWGDTALVGSNQDDDAGSNSGSAYVFRLYPPDITVEQPLGSGAFLLDGVGSINFGGVAQGSGSAAKTFTITNSGGSELSSIAIIKDGADADAFTVDTSGMLTTLPSGGSTTFSVVFTAAGPVAVTTPRSAALHIASNALGTKNPFDIALAGLALSPTADSDADGLNDAGELLLAGAGFDWQVGQPTQVAALFATGLYNQTQYDANLANGITTGQNNILNDPNAFNLYNLSQIQALNVGVPLLQRNPATDVFTLTIGVKKSTDLTTFDPFPMSGPQISINGEGKLEFEFTVPDDAAFFRVESND